ncbi:MAG: hypothetical protein Q8P24_13480 [Desulfobacterales bacterium]|nr:hypothetical protein [Desulfobacterales bacterium]
MKLACDLSEKQSMIQVFSTALGFLSPELWQDRLQVARVIICGRNFALEPADTFQIIVSALKSAPKESRSEGIDAAKGILGEIDFTAVLEHLLAAVLRLTDHPWHKIIREQVGELDRPTVRVVSLQEIIAGKLLAFLDRSAFEMPGIWLTCRFRLKRWWPRTSSDPGSLRFPPFCPIR